MGLVAFAFRLKVSAGGREGIPLPIPNLSNGSWVNSFVGEGPMGSK